MAKLRSLVQCAPPKFCLVRRSAAWTRLRFWIFLLTFPQRSYLEQILNGDAAALIDLLVLTGISSSKGEARRLIQSGGVSVNNRRVAELQSIPLSQFIDGKILVLRKGAKNYHLVKLVG